MKSLESRIKNGALRLRRFITFGSPITLVACRSDAVVQILSDGKQLDARDYGLQSHLRDGVSELDGPRWINFWDKDDLISWPVEPLMSDSRAAAQDISISMYQTEPRKFTAHIGPARMSIVKSPNDGNFVYPFGLLVPSPIRFRDRFGMANGDRSNTQRPKRNGS